MKLQLSQHQELSITDLFRDYLNEIYNLQDVELNEELSLYENIKNLCDKNGKLFIKKCNNALKYAYDTKYGNWDNVNDLRTLYPNKWCDPISTLLSNVNESQKLIDIGCNDGRELKDILKENFYKPDITLIDISQKAIERFQHSVVHNHIKVVNDSFLTTKFKENYFDFCLSLRTLHSSGIDTHESVKKCYKITKPNGVIILSVSNGYIDDITGEPLKGMYNYSTGLVDEEKPFIIARNMADTLLSLNGITVEIIEGNSEIFIIGKKNNKT